MSLSFSPRADTEGFEEEVIVVFDGRESLCGAWGFCTFWEVGYPYFSRPYHVVRTLADRPDVIRRVLAHGLLNANPLPGLLNRTAPSAELSLLEKQTLKMQSMRPIGTRWPDTAASR